MQAHRRLTHMTAAMRARSIKRLTLHVDQHQRWTPFAMGINT